jgi:hypothetical protein
VNLRAALSLTRQRVPVKALAPASKNCVTQPCEINKVLIISRKDIPVWKSSNVNTHNVKLHYSNSGHRINDIFILSVSDAYAFILSNRYSSINNNNPKTKRVEVTLIHTWQQEIKESQLKNR